MEKKIFVAICLTPEKKAYKYRMMNTQRSLSSFERFAKTLNIEYINYYEKETRRFVRRVKLE
jgi:hypothetical protein